MVTVGADVCRYHKALGWRGLADASGSPLADKTSGPKSLDAAADSRHFLVPKCRIIYTNSTRHFCSDKSSYFMEVYRRERSLPFSHWERA